METKELTNHLPRYNSAPRSQNQAQRKRKWAVSLRPGNRPHFNATVCARNRPGRIDQDDGNASKRNMLPTSLSQCVISGSFAVTAGTDHSAWSIRDQVNNQMVMFITNLFHTMSLEIQALSYYTFKEHGSYPPSYRLLTNRK